MLPRSATAKNKRSEKAAIKALPSPTTTNHNLSTTTTLFFFYFLFFSTETTTISSVHALTKEIPYLLSMGNCFTEPPSEQLQHFETVGGVHMTETNADILRLTPIAWRMLT